MKQKPPVLSSCESNYPSQHNYRSRTNPPQERTSKKQKEFIPQLPGSHTFLFVCLFIFFFFKKKAGSKTAIKLGFASVVRCEKYICGERDRRLKLTPLLVVFYQIQYCYRDLANCCVQFPTEHHRKCCFYPFTLVTD